MNIGIIREGKNPPDKRVAFSPKQCREIMEKYPKVRIFVQPSPLRCFKDEEYVAQGCELSEDLSYCDLLFGIKEVPVEMLIPRKIYLFFSHTIKKQPYNRKLLQAILKNKITMVDYETLKNPTGDRVVAFGRYAGLVGAYNGILAYGKRFNLFDLRPAHSLFDRKEMQLELQKVKLPPIKIAVTGNGRVTKGAMEMLDAMNIRRVSVDEYLKSTSTEPIYVQLRSADYHQHKQLKTFGNDFYAQPESYESSFDKFYRTTDLLIATAYWNPQAPVLFSKEAMRSADFKIKVIADVTCDINGSIPSTLKASTIAEPLYDYNPKTESIEKPLSSIDNVTVMAIDNLPCEMPRDASVDFGQDLIQKVLPCLLGEDTEQLIEKATIAKHGRLTSHFQYLEEYVLQEA
jgi:saccharopine dehydrogenase (NAD+, L-lysine-forming)